MKKEFVNIGLIGYGSRGLGTLDLLLSIDDVHVVAVCDKYADRAEAAQAKVKETRGTTPAKYLDYKELLKDSNVEMVAIVADWEMHIPMALDAMRAGKAVCLEVGGAYSVKDCYDLVNVQKETKAPFMFLENCCFNREELLVANMARAGKFGRIVHCKGAYAHDLREEVIHGKENRHYRLRNYRYRNAENYPTHELGPIARVLGINRGNRMVSLVSVASGAFGLEDYVQKKKDSVDPALQGVRFKQGDIVNTVITCANGETILLTLDTTLPRSYTRDFTVRGTDGMYEMGTNSVFLDGDKEYWEPVEYNQNTINNAKKFEDEFLPEIWKKITPEEIAAGHGGMDAVLWRSLLDAYENGEEMPIDVYDAASWMVITALSEESIALGGAPVAIPDFTDGKWTARENVPVLK